MRKTVYISNFTKINKGFTLIEILVVLTLIGIVFSVLSFGFYNSIYSSLSISQRSRELEDVAKFYWDFQRKFSTSKQIFIKKISQNNYIITLYNTSGEFSKGLVKSVYFTKENFLWYYEYPYLFADPYFYDETKSVKVIPVKDFNVEINYNGQKVEEAQGFLDFLKLNINNYTLTFKNQ